MNTIEEAQSSQRESARVRLVDALWKSAPPADLLALAAQAGMTVAEADGLATKIDRLRERKRLADLADQRRAAHVKAKAQHESAEKRHRPTIDRLESEIEQLFWIAEVARRELIDPELAEQDLVAAEMSGMAPRSKLSDHAERQRADEDERNAPQRRWVAAEAAIRRGFYQLDIVRRQRDRMDKHGIANLNDRTVAEVRKDFDAGVAAIRKQMAELKAATEAANAAGFKVIVPESIARDFADAVGS